MANIYTSINGTIYKELPKIPKNDDGSIERKESIKLIQKIYKDNWNFYTLTNQGDGRALFGTNQLSYVYSGILSQYKELFDLYTDKDSEGGEKITPNELKEIKETIYNWETNMEEHRKDLLQK